MKFLPAGVEVSAQSGRTLLRSAREAGIRVRQTCGGQGTCNKCAMILREGTVDSAQEGAVWTDEGGTTWVLSCQVVANPGAVLEIPAAAALAAVTGGQGVLTEADEEETPEFDPLLAIRSLELPLPDLQDNGDDLIRLQTVLTREEGTVPGISLSALRKLPLALREDGFRVNVLLSRPPGSSLVGDVWPRAEASTTALGLAVDVGTTTVAAALVDLEQGYTLGAEGEYNAQVTMAEDVISRIIYAEEHPDGLAELQRAVVDTIGGLVRRLGRKHGVAPAEIKVGVVAGNTTMLHLLLGIPPAYLRREPYVPAASRFPAVRAGELGLNIDPEALVYSLPAVASYLGGDLVAGVLATGMGRREETTLLIDIGTNGEMILGNSDWLIGCACSAGPAFEGSGIRHGTRAVPGAIDGVRVLDGGREVEVAALGARPPIGICGSGLIDALGSMAEAGVVDRAGKFRTDLPGGRLLRGENGPEFLLSRKEGNGIGEDITLAQSDLDNLIRAKGAIFAGMRSLLVATDMGVHDIDRVLIAGGFGRHLSLDKAIRIGLLPDLPRERFRYVGNTSLKGARHCLLSRRVYAEALAVADRLTYLDLSLGPNYMDEFVSSLFLPHTDLSLFPSVGRVAG